MKQIMGNVDILVISKTKPDSSFLSGQFLINGYSELFRVDRNCQGGAVLYVREDIQSKLLRVEKSQTESLYVEINLQKIKWLSYCSYNHTKITFNLI